MLIYGCLAYYLQGDALMSWNNYLANFDMII